MSAEDRFSALPEHLIHHIMSFLEYRDAVRMSALSHMFRLVWYSYPIICFNRHHNEGCYEKPLSEWVNRQSIRYKLLNHVIQTDAFLQYTSDFLRRRAAPSETTLQKFCFIFGEGFLRYHAEPTDRNQDCRIDDAINYAIENHVKELILDFVGPRVSLSGMACRFYPLPHSVMSARSITVLRLEGLKFASQDLVFTSPIICSLNIESCSGLRFLRVRVSCEKLKTVHVINCYKTPEKIEIGAPNLDLFSYADGHLMWEQNAKHCEIDILACKSLQHLILQSPGLSKEWVEQNLSGLPFLKTIRLIGCNALNNLKISHNILTTVELSRCMNMRKVEINASSMDSFFFLCCLERTPSLFLNSSARLKAVISFPLFFLAQDFDWTSYLTEFLVSFGHCIELKIHFRNKEILVIPYKLRGMTSPPLYDLKNLYLVNMVEELLEVQLVQIVDSVLWLAPRVEFISIICDSGEKTIQLSYALHGDDVEDLPNCIGIEEVTLNNFKPNEEEILQELIKKYDKRVPTNRQACL